MNIKNMSEYRLCFLHNTCTTSILCRITVGCDSKCLCTETSKYRRVKILCIHWGITLSSRRQHKNLLAQSLLMAATENKWICSLSKALYTKGIQARSLILRQQRLECLTSLITLKKQNFCTEKTAFDKNWPLYQLNQAKPALLNPGPQGPLSVEILPNL